VSRETNDKTAVLVVLQVKNIDKHVLDSHGDLYYYYWYGSSYITLSLYLPRRIKEKNIHNRNPYDLT
jgi:hypothetical protein